MKRKRSIDDTTTTCGVDRNDVAESKVDDCLDQEIEMATIIEKEIMKLLHKRGVEKSI